MKRSLILTACVALVLFIGSCGKSTCLNPGIHITFKGFDSIELSRVLILQYVHNTNYTTLLSVRVFDTANTEIVQSNDTTYMPHIDTSGAALAPGYDYIIAVPSVPTSFFSDSAFKISNISYTETKQKAAMRGGCTNDASYYLDSIPTKAKGVLTTQSNLPPVVIVLNK